MGTLREAGTTALNLRALGVDESIDPLLQRVRQEAQENNYDVLGEMGRGGAGRVVYLARDQISASLVALRLEPGRAANQFILDVVETLDASLPAMESTCPVVSCGAKLRGWGRYCPMCGADLGGFAGSGRDAHDQLLHRVREVAEGRFEVLGQMSRSQGGGYVYFAKDARTGELTALRLQQADDGAFELDLTGVLPSLARSIDDRHETGSPMTVAPPPSLSQPQPRQTRFPSGPRVYIQPDATDFQKWIRSFVREPINVIGAAIVILLFFILVVLVTR